MYDFLLVTNIVTVAVSANVFEILTLKARKSLNFRTPPFFEAPGGYRGGSPTAVQAYVNLPSVGAVPQSPHIIVD